MHSFAKETSCASMSLGSLFLLIIGKFASITPFVGPLLPEGYPRWPLLCPLCLHATGEPDEPLHYPRPPAHVMACM